MDLALAIFNIGVGLGVLAAGVALGYLAWQTTPLIRESRALARDLRRLTRTADEELGQLVAQAKEVATGVEVLSADVAVQIHRLGEATAALEERLEPARRPVAAGTGRGAAGRIVGNTRGCSQLMKDSGFGSFLAGVIIGGLIGAAIGLLLAPQTGDELRDQVGDFVDGKKADWDDAINEGKAAAEQARAEMVSEFEAASEGPA